MIIIIVLTIIVIIVMIVAIIITIVITIRNDNTACLRGGVHEARTTHAHTIIPPRRWIKVDLFFLIPCQAGICKKRET